MQPVNLLLSLIYFWYYATIAYGGFTIIEQWKFYQLIVFVYSLIALLHLTISFRSLRSLRVVFAIKISNAPQPKKKP